MALTYQQSAELMNNGPFRGRIKVGCLKFADYILAEAVDTPAHNTRLKWAQQALQMPDAAASQAAPPTVMDTAVQGSDIDPATGDCTLDDAGLQSAVETTINKML